MTTAVPDTGQGAAQLETVFDGHVIFLRLPEAAPGDAREYVEQQIDAFGVTGLPTELWLDDDDCIIRQSYVLDLGRIAAGGATESADLEDLEGEVSTTIEYFDFGPDVDVEPPSADEITDFAELVENATEAAGEDG